MKGYASEAELIQNLRDAGCSEDMAAAFVEDIRQGEMEAGQRMLEGHRRCLLNDLHRAQKHIDCLDYLLYQMNKRA